MFVGIIFKQFQPNEKVVDLKLKFLVNLHQTFHQRSYSPAESTIMSAMFRFTLYILSKQHCLIFLPQCKLISIHTGSWTDLWNWLRSFFSMPRQVPTTCELTFRISLIKTSLFLPVKLTLHISFFKTSLYWPVKLTLRSFSSMTSPSIFFIFSHRPRWSPQ